MYHRAVATHDTVIIDFSECYYIDQEGIRWLTAAKAEQKAALADRRKSDTRRDRDLDRRGASDRKRGPGRRRGRSDRRRRSEF